jgi:hypothetical protein
MAPERRKKLFKAVTALTVVAVLGCAVWIMAHRLGLAPEYDFGAGAYYYADIPGYENVVRDDAYHTDIPVWIHIVLFLAWGWLMYRLWVWIDNRK